MFCCCAGLDRSSETTVNPLMFRVVGQSRVVLQRSTFAELFPAKVFPSHTSSCNRDRCVERQGFGQNVYSGRKTSKQMVGGKTG